VLVQCAFAAARAKNTYLQAQFLRLKARRGPKKAAIAVAASILTALYHMLRDGIKAFSRGLYDFDVMPARECFGGSRWGRSILHREEKPKGRRWVLAANCASNRDKTSILRVRSSWF